MRKHLDEQYGDDPRERVDVFLPNNDGAPLFAFIHGGYWQWNDKEGFEFLAKELNAHGAAFANIEYTLCPGVTLAELTNHGTASRRIPVERGCDLRLRPRPDRGFRSFRGRASDLNDAGDRLVGA